MGVAIQFVVTLAIACGIVYIFVRRNRERDRNAPLPSEIEAGVSFRARLDHASVLGTGGFGGTRGVWIALRGPKRLTVGADGFVVSAPQALREFVFTGRDSSIAVSRAPSRIVNRDWRAITLNGRRPAARTRYDERQSAGGLAGAGRNRCDTGACGGWVRAGRGTVASGLAAG